MEHTHRSRSLSLVATFLTATVVSLAMGEVILRAVGFTYFLYPEKVEFGWPDPVTMQDHFVPDEDLMWVTEDYYDKLASLRENRPSIVYMGCSCTQYGRYDEHLKTIIDREHPGNDFTFGNVGVGGWSTYQGLRQLEKHIAQIEPRVVTIFYGWNDHWVGFGIEDKNVAKVTSSRLQEIRRLRLTQLINKSFVALVQEREDSEFPRRVSPKDFRNNLRAMVGTARDNDIIPVLVTAPTSHVKGNEPLHLQERFIRDVDQLVPLHQEYADIVREVAKTEDVTLADLARQFDRLPRHQVEKVYFSQDGIHLTDPGNRMIAEFLYKCFKENDLLDVLL
jgi:lysophospholipase L1-like esterase